MQRFKLVLPCFLFALAALAPAANAKPAFIDVKVTLTDGNIREVAPRLLFHGGLLLSFFERGVPGSSATTYTVTADAKATYACINGGDNHPQAANKTGVIGPVTGSGTFVSDANGRVTGEVPVPPLGPGSFVCPLGQDVVLSDVSYTNVRIHDVTHDVWANAPGTYSLVLVPLQ